jgi:hypothetical protein
MPKIPEYDSAISGSAKAPQAYADPNVARHAGDNLIRAGHELQKAAGAAWAIQDRSDKVELQKRLSAARADLSSEQDAAIRSGAAADPAWTKAFNEKVTDRIGQLGDGLASGSARAMAGAYGAQLSAHFMESSLQGHAVAAGIEQKATFERGLALDANAVMNDPNLAQMTLAQYEAMLDDPKGAYALIPQAQREALKAASRESLAVAAVQGTIYNLSPDLAIKQLKGGEWDDVLGPKNKAALISHAETYKRTQEDDVMRQLRVQHALKAESDRKLTNAFVNKMTDGSVSNEDIMRSPLEGPQKVTLVKLNNSMAVNLSANWQSDPKVVDEFQQRIYAPDDDPRKLTNEEVLYNAFQGRQLGRDDFLRLRAAFNDEQTRSPFGRRTQDVSNLAKRAIMSSLDAALRPDQAITGYYKWRKDLDEQIQKFRDDGKDPRVLLDPKSKDYFAAPERLQSYLPSHQLGTVPRVGADGTLRLPNGQVFKLKPGGDPNKNEDYIPIAAGNPELVDTSETDYRE